MPDAPDRDEMERDVRLACEAGDHERAATLALELYGREVLAFLISRLDEQRGSEVFSDFLLDFWRGLPAFAWRSSLRSWSYTLARHAVARRAGSPQQRREVLGVTTFSAAADRVRTETAAYLRTQVKDGFRELRAQLPEDDQTLLILRIDRNLPWNELAVVLGEVDADASGDELRAASARLRQRFQSVKAELRRRAQAAGLLPSDDDSA